MIAPRIRRLFSALKHSPLHPQWLVFQGDTQRKQAFAQHIHGELLDIGCGNKPLSQVLASDVHYTGMDYPGTVSKGYDGKADVFGDGQRLPFRNACFDCVTLLDVMEHMPWPEAAFMEMLRVTQPGGLIITQTPFLYPLHDVPHDFQRWTAEGLLQFAHRHPVEIMEITHHGRPLETAAALANLALAKGMLESLHDKHPSLLLLPLAAIAVLCINLLGWFFARLLPDQGFMPLGYTVIFRKKP